MLPSRLQLISDKSLPHRGGMESPAQAFLEHLSQRSDLVALSFLPESIPDRYLFDQGEPEKKASTCAGLLDNGALMGGQMAGFSLKQVWKMIFKGYELFT